MVASRAQKATVLLVLLAALAMLVGCAAKETPTPEAAPVAEVSPEPTEEVAEPTEELPAEEPTAKVEVSSEEGEGAESEEPAPEPTPEPTLEPTPEPTPTPVVVVDVDSACVNCHTDVDRLKELAEEPEAVHLSSGEG
jgi:hypothetical protein